MHRGGRKFKLFSAGSGFKGQIFTGELSGYGFNWGTEAGCIKDLLWKRDL